MRLTVRNRDTGASLIADKSIIEIHDNLDTASQMTPSSHTQYLEVEPGNTYQLAFHLSSSDQGGTNGSPPFIAGRQVDVWYYQAHPLDVQMEDFD